VIRQFPEKNPLNSLQTSSEDNSRIGDHSGVAYHHLAVALVADFGLNFGCARLFTYGAHMGPTRHTLWLKQIGEDIDFPESVWNAYLELSWQASEIRNPL
jgi:hypothetical protein